MHSIFYSLLLTINWVNELQLNNVDFELDSKRVRWTVFNHLQDNVSNFGDIVIDDCGYFSPLYFQNSHIDYVMRKATQLVHALAKAVIYILLVSKFFIDVLICIKQIIINKKKCMFKQYIISIPLMCSGNYF